MRRRIWLMAVAAALFGVQAPLCVLACLPGPAAEAVAAHRTAPPCHEPDPGASPSEAPHSHEDCGCEVAYRALPSSSDGASGVATQGFFAANAHGPSPRSGLRWAPAAPEATDLPPPDILLLKSTLLI